MKSELSLSHSLLVSMAGRTLGCMTRLTVTSGDPFNQTMADNAEWLRRFKRDVNILEDDGGPGLYCLGAY